MLSLPPPHCQIVTHNKNAQRLVDPEAQAQAAGSRGRDAVVAATTGTGIQELPTAEQSPLAQGALWSCCCIWQVNLYLWPSSHT